MTVKQLKEILEEFDDSLLVVIPETSENSEPNPKVIIFPVNTNYWTNEYKLETLPKDKEFIKL